MALFRPRYGRHAIPLMHRVADLRLNPNTYRRIDHPWHAQTDDDRCSTVQMTCSHPSTIALPYATVSLIGQPGPATEKLSPILGASLRPSHRHDSPHVRPFQP